MRKNDAKNRERVGKELMDEEQWATFRGRMERRRERKEN